MSSNTAPKRGLGAFEGRLSALHSGLASTHSGQSRAPDAVNPTGLTRRGSPYFGSEDPKHEATILPVRPEPSGPNEIFFGRTHLSGPRAAHRQEPHWQTAV